MRFPTSDAGQASLEYAGVLVLVAVVLGLVATAVAAPDLPGAVVRHLRVALCIVGGDVCRDRDARARGLEPCVRFDETHDQEDTLTVILGGGDRQRWRLTERSDGVWLLSAALGRHLEASADLVRLRAGSLVDGGIGASLDGHWLSGSVWELTEAQAKAVVARTRGHAAGLADDHSAAFFGLPEPTFRYREGGVSAQLEAALTIGDDRGGTDLDLAAADRNLVLGRREGGGGDVWYLRSTAAVETALAGLGLQPAHGGVEYHAGPPAALVVRATARTADEETEHVVTLPVARPDVRRAVRAALLDDGAGEALRELLHEHALRERRTYRVDTDEGGLAVRVAGIGFEHRTSTVRRRLTGAELLEGGRKVQRVDCLGTP